jgi:hypothetical protein
MVHFVGDYSYLMWKCTVKTKWKHKYKFLAYDGDLKLK